MSAHAPSPHGPKLDLSRWAKVPNLLLGGGAVLVIIGIAVSWMKHGDLRQFGFSWLLAFMFCLSLCLGPLFLVLIHHLFDASWSLPLRRVMEHMAAQIKWLALAFIPIGLLARSLYHWMSLDPAKDHALAAKQVLFNWPMFYVVSVALFVIWYLLTNGLRKWSLEQDKTGAAECTFKMRRLSAGGIYVFAFSLTLAAIFWVKALEHQWFSTMYGVYYFAETVWTTIATVYIIMAVLRASGTLSAVLTNTQFYFLGTLQLAFTVFYAYIHFSQYFLIWNAAMPEETFWYIQRETGSWNAISLIVVFGHFLVPFLALLRIDVKLNVKFMFGVAVWVWLMHYIDMSFNIMPVLHPEGFPWKWIWLDVGCIAVILGLISKMFVKDFLAHAPYPVRDPRLHETMGVVLVSPGHLADGHKSK